MSPRSASRGTPAPDGLLSIGALSAATGIPIPTIRSWERRYGFPAADRKPSGHRVYPLDTVPRLRRIAEAIRRGHRAAEALTASEATLTALLLSLDRMGLTSPRIYSRAVEGASRLDELSGRERRHAVIAFQSAVAIMERARLADAIDIATAERLILALADTAGRPERRGRAIVQWMSSCTQAEQA